MSAAALEMPGLVGRDAILTRLAAVFDDVLGGRGRLVVLEGEPGIGKTALLRALCGHARQHGGLVLSGRCASHLEGQPYLLFKDLIRNWVHVMTSDGESAHLSGTRGLSFEQLLTFAEDRLGIASDIDRHTDGRAWVHDFVSRLIFDSAGRQLLVLALEDLQWADISSLALLNYVVRNITTNNVLVCVTYRPQVSREAPRSDALLDLVVHASVENLGEHIVLDRLDQDSTARLVQTTLAPSELPQALLQRIYDETEGVPLYVLELLKALSEQGAVVQREGIWRLVHETETIRLPRNLVNLIDLRFFGLEKEDRELLECAAVMGRRFRTDVLAQAMQRPRLDVLRSLQDIERSLGLVHALNGGYAFDHNLIQEVMYGEISDELKCEYHAIIGDCLERDPLTDPFELAHHYARGHRYEKAIRYSVEAGEKAEAVYAYLEAIAYYEQALSCLDVTGPKSIEMSFRLLNRLGDLYATTTRSERSLRYYQMALRHHDSVSAPSAELRLYRNMGFISLLRGELHRAFDFYQEGVRLVSRDHNHLAAAQLYYDMACLHLKMGHDEEAYNWCRQAVPAARLLDPEVDFDQLLSVYELLPALSSLSGYAAPGGPADAVGIAALPGFSAPAPRTTSVMATREVPGAPGHSPLPRDGHLTHRELDVLRLIVEGRSNKEIAARLQISIKTVDRHLANTFEKTHVRSRSQLVAYAFHIGLVTVLGAESE